MVSDMVSVDMLETVAWTQAPVGGFLLRADPKGVPALRGTVRDTNPFIVNLGREDGVFGIDLQKARIGERQATGLLVRGATIVIDPASIVVPTNGDDMNGCITIKAGSLAIYAGVHMSWGGSENMPIVLQGEDPETIAGVETVFSRWAVVVDNEAGNRTTIYSRG